VQDELFQHIPGLERAQIMRYGYAVEYDFCPPDQLWPSLETKSVAGLFFAGQINGTTGYEEAGAQGVIAGVNAALKLQSNDPLILGREQAYIGVLIDDLVTCGVDEPYRMFTSRAEHRLRLRHDNADRRLTKMAAELGLVDADRLARLQQKESRIAAAMQLIDTNRVGQETLAKLLRRPEVDWPQLVTYCPQLANFEREVVQQIVFDVKYAGYIARQEIDIARQQRMAARRIPKDLDYEKLTQLRHEAREKLGRVRPLTLAQAGRISGITPADISRLLVYLEGSRP
jgi:tRNA uridine 5-carboxymethylaminomethyl modification enzyme